MRASEQARRVRGLGLHLAACLASARARGTAIDDPWGDLMVASQKGDRDAYRQLLTALDNWARLFFAEAVPAGDLDRATSATLLAVHEFRHTYRRSQRFESWLVAIASHERDRYRVQAHAIAARGSQPGPGAPPPEMSGHAMRSESVVLPAFPRPWSFGRQIDGRSGVRRA